MVIYKENQWVFIFGGEGGEGDDDENEGEEGVERGAQGGVGGHGDEEEEEEEHEEEEQEECVAEAVEGAGDGFEEAWLSQRRRCQNSSSDWIKQKDVISLQRMQVRKEIYPRMETGQQFGQVLLSA